MSDFMSHEAVAHDAAALPVVVPPRLIGRDAALAQIYPHLKAGQPVLIYGSAGVGKTAVGATLANAYVQQPPGVLWFPARGDNLDSLLVRVGRAYGIAEIANAESPSAMVGAVANTLSQHKPFIVIDGHIDAQVASKFVSRCANGLPVLIISRENLEGSWSSIELKGLEPASAVALYKQDAAIQQNAADADIAEIVKTLNYQPYTIGIAARAMLATKKSPAEFKTGIAQVTASLGNATQAALTTSFAALNGALQGLVLVMGAIYNGQASAELLGSVAGAPQENVLNAMKILVGLRLIEQSQRYGQPYFKLHPITQAFVLDRLKSSGNLENLQQKVLSVLTKYVDRYAVEQVNHNKLAMEIENIMSAARSQVNTNRELIAELTRKLNSADDFAQARGYTHELGILRGFSRSGSSAFPAHPPEENFPQPPTEEETQPAPPDIFSMLDEIDEDVDEEAFESDDIIETDSEPIVEPVDEITRLRTELAQARQDENQNQQANILTQIGQLQVAEDNDAGAITTYEEALTLYEATRNQASTLQTLVTLTDLMDKQENPQGVILNASRGIKIAGELNEDKTQMKLLMQMGDARQQLGESEQAVEHYTDALAIAEDSSDSENEAIILYQLGYAQLDSGDTEEAILNWENALSLFREQNKRDYEGKILGALGTAYGEKEQWSEAVNFHTSALHIAREVNDKEEEALQLGSLGFASVQANQLGQAVTRYRQALHIAYEANDRDNIVSTIVDLVRLLLKSPLYLDIADLLVEDGLEHDPTDKDLNSLKDRIGAERMLAQANGVEFKEVHGTAQRYAENAYKLLND